MPRVPFHKRRRGASALELALVTPVIVLLATSILDWAWYFHEQTLVLEAVHDSARKGATTNQDADPEGEALALLQQRLAAWNLDSDEATLDASLSGSSPDTEITVSASIPFRGLTGIALTPDAVEATMTMRLEDN